MKLVLADTLTLDTGFPNGEKIHLCGLRPPVCGIWLWQPEQTNTLPLQSQEVTSPVSGRHSRNTW